MKCTAPSPFCECHKCFAAKHGSQSRAVDLVTGAQNKTAKERQRVRQMPTIGDMWPKSDKSNVSDQTPRTQDVANTTDSLERLSASVLFGLLLLVGFISGPSSVGAQETPIDHPRPAESHRTTDKMDNTGNPIILGNEAEPRLEALSADTYGKSAFGSFGEPSPQTSGTAHSALESSLTDQVGSLSGGERASESTMQARRLSPTGFVLLGVIVQLLLMAATWSNVVPVEHPKWLSLNIRYTAVAVLITMLLQPYVLSLVSSLESSGALIHCPNAEVCQPEGAKKL